MSIVTISDLEAFTSTTDDGRYQSYIDTAEAAVADHVGVETLDQRSVVERITIHRDSRSLFTDIGPLASITEVRGWGDFVLPTDPIAPASFELLSVWQAELADSDIEPFRFGQVVELDAVFGWIAGDLPDDFRQAILNAAAWVRSVHPESGISSERLGDYQYSLRQAPGSLEQSLPGISVALLRKHVRPTA